MTREFIEGNLQIDGRMIEYQLVTASDYLQEKEKYNDEQINEFIDNNYNAYVLITQIMALKQACYLLRRTSHSCQSLPDELFNLKLRLILELKELNFNFDDQFMENYKE